MVRYIIILNSYMYIYLVQVFCESLRILNKNRSFVVTSFWSDSDSQTICWTTNFLKEIWKMTIFSEKYWKKNPLHGFCPDFIG